MKSKLLFTRISDAELQHIELQDIKIYSCILYKINI